MKLLLILSLLIISISSFATTKNIRCNTFYQVAWDMSVDIAIEGSITKNGENSYSITNRYIYLSIDEDDNGSSWYKFEGRGESAVHNLRFYNPRKYQGHVKFAYDHDIKADNPSHNWDENLFGYFELLIPSAQLDEADSGDTFNSVAIMTYIEDHWGGSRTLKCTIL